MGMRVAAYKVISNSKVWEFEEIVRDHIRDGWVPQGGIATEVRAGQIFYLQAMTRG